MAAGFTRRADESWTSEFSLSAPSPVVVVVDEVRARVDEHGPHQRQHSRPPELVLIGSVPTSTGMTEAVKETGERRPTRGEQSPSASTIATGMRRRSGQTPFVMSFTRISTLQNRISTRLTARRGVARTVGSGDSRELVPGGELRMQRCRSP
jgi:hypothetical protein